ncbi:MAG: S26 family signal peptidase, partial [Propionibacteriaceae bacterium]|nr:S26 family signal peptidase [Propionibacteriaceae bacterium]
MAAGQVEETSGARLRPRKPTPLWLALLGNLVVALAIVSLVQGFVVRVHNVASGSMQTTLGVRDRVLSSNLPYLADDPERGDIVIFG